MVTPPNVLAFRTLQTPPRPNLQPAHTTPDVLVGPSAAMAHLWSQIRRVAPYFRTALLLGERGAGTEAVAQALHSLSPFAKSAFVEMTTQDIETRLTSAAMMKLAGDTLFLPEVERLSASAQRSILRLMRMRKSKQVCVIASATGDLKPLVSAGQFSGVLAQALSGLHLAVVPLRERREDLPSLIEHLLQHEAKARGVDVPQIAGDTLAKLIEHPWPGNLTQLQAVLRELRLQPGVDIDTLASTSHRDAEPPAVACRLLKLDEVVQEHIRTVLLRCNGNKLKAAEVLGISRSTLYRMLEQPPIAA